MARFLVEPRGEVPAGEGAGQADLTASSHAGLPAALAAARELARQVGRDRGQAAAVAYVWKEGTQEVWSVQWHPEEGEAITEALVDRETGRPVLEDGEPVLRIRHLHRVEWRIVHDPSRREHDYAPDESGAQLVVNERWEGAIEVTDLDADGNRLATVDDRSTRALQGVTHVEVREARRA
jgi:hypothetical protein